MKKRVFLLLLIVFCLNAVGLLVLTSASIALVNSVFLKKQLYAEVIALVICFIFAKISLRSLERSHVQLYIFSLIGLILTLLPMVGKVVNGSRRWIPILGFNLQVSEFAKIALIVWLAGYINNHSAEIGSLVKGFIKPLVICCFLSLFVLLEPDYGTTFLMVTVSLLMLFLSGIRWKYLLFCGILGTLFFISIIFLSPVRLRRVTSFLFVEQNRFDATYQLWQSLLCFASGGLYGKGIGLGRQKLSYLPEAHTDFIFPVLGEEFGALFAIAIILLFAIFISVALTGLYLKKNTFVRSLGYGATLIIALQVIINIGMVTGCCPTKGMALPFISYGGSNLIAMYALVGLIINCLLYKERAEFTVNHPPVFIK